MKYLLSVLVLLLGLSPCRLYAQNIPDMPAIEAMIALHKTNANAEKESLQQHEQMLALRKLVQNGVTKVKQGHEILASRTHDVVGYATMSVELAYIGAKLVKLGNAAEEYVKLVPEIAQRNPAGLWYYLEGVSQCYKEAEKLPKKFALLSGKLFMLNATMEEKIALVHDIQMSIGICMLKLDDALFWATMDSSVGFIEMTVWDIFESISKEHIAEKVIDEFSKL